MNLKRSFRWGLVSAVLAAGAFAASAASAATLRICSDPDNLPFSKADGSDHGLYVDLANLVAQKLDAQPEYFWWLSLNQRKALRNSVLAGKCDAYFALPADADYGTRGLKRSQAFLDVGYAVVAPKEFTFSSLEDLRDKRVGVEFGSTPQFVLAVADGYDMVTFRRQEEILAALDKGEIDVAFMWGPTAGYGNHANYQDRWRVTPVSGEHMDHQVAVAVPEADTELLSRIDQALVNLRPQIKELAGKYGFPQGTPVTLSAIKPAHSAVAAADPSSARLKRVDYVVAAADPSSAAAPADAKAAATPAADGADAAAAGRKVFNSTCSHCHSPDGASPLRARDLRRLKGKYDDEWKEMAKTTIEDGRPNLGMPAWKDTLSAAQIDEIMAFLPTIQND